MKLDRDELIHYLKTAMNLELDTVGDDESLFSSNLLDSFHMVELIQFIETKCEIRMTANDITMDNLDTVGSILSFSAARSNTSAASQ